MTLIRGTSSWAAAGVVGFFVLCALVFAATPARAATLTTDKADYFPGETATIYGSLFDALQNVVLSIVGQNSDGSTATTATWGVTADDAGSFTTSYTLPDTFVPLYLLAADSADGTVLAETSFTDNKNIAVTFAGTGSGSVSASPVIGSPTSCTSNCNFAEANTGTGTLTATAGVGSTFVGWSSQSAGVTGCVGNTCNFAMANGAQSVTATFNATVQNQTITVTTPAPGSATYGSSFSVAAHASSGLPVAVTTSGSCTNSGNDVTMTSGTGTCTMHYNQAGNGSYNPAPEVTSNTTANKASPDCSVTGYSATYDGNPHTATGSCAGVNGEGPLAGLDLSGTTHTNAGTYNGDAWSYPGTANYNSANGTVDDAIAKAPAGCSISGYSGIYDGNLHGASGSCTGTGTLDLGASFADVPGGTANWGFTGNSNHENDGGSVSIDISQAPSSVTVDCTVSAPFTYTGLAQTPCTASASGVGMIDVDVTGSLDYHNNTNAGLATADASWGGDINHTGNVGSGSFTIDPATLTITASSGSMIQGGTVPAITPGYSGFVNGETSSILTTPPSCSTIATPTSAPGDYLTSCTGAAATNYTFNYVTGTMHVYVWSSIAKGLFSPLGISAKTFQKNSAIPVKFALNGGAGNFYGGEAQLYICQEAAGKCAKELPVSGDGWFAPTAKGGSNSGNFFRYDPSAGQYIYNLDTKNVSIVAGKTYDFEIVMFGTPWVADQVAVIKVTK